MAHWAEIDQNNIVIRVVVVQDSDESTERQWLEENLGGVWLKTSYNTFAGEHALGKTPLRKNYAGPGYSYDLQRDAFIPPKPLGMNSWILEEQTCQWIPPIPIPDSPNNEYWYWDEETVSWVEDPELNSDGTPKLV